jgi:hypothetical protein
METTRTTAPRSPERSWDMEMILVVVIAGLALMAVTVATRHYNPAPLDVEAGWFFCP